MPIEEVDRMRMRAEAAEELLAEALSAVEEQNDSSGLRERITIHLEKARNPNAWRNDQQVSRVQDL